MSVNNYNYGSILPALTEYSNLRLPFECECVENEFDSGNVPDVEYVLQDVIDAYGMQYGVPGIVSISYRSNKTEVRWMDGTTTKVRCGEGENFDRYTGFMAAVCKKLFGSTTAAKNLRNRLDADVLNARAKAEREAEDAEARRIRAKREKNQVKRRARQIALEMMAQEKAKELIESGEVK